MSIFSQDVFERAVKTFAQTLVAFFVGNVTILNANWVQILSVAGTAALISILTSLASSTLGGGPSASTAHGVRSLAKQNEELHRTL